MNSKTFGSQNACKTVVEVNKDFEFEKLLDLEKKVYDKVKGVRNKYQCLDMDRSLDAIQRTNLKNDMKVLVGLHEYSVKIDRQIKKQEIELKDQDVGEINSSSTTYMDVIFKSPYSHMEFTENKLGKKYRVNVEKRTFDVS